MIDISLTSKRKSFHSHIETSSAFFEAEQFQTSGCEEGPSHPTAYVPGSSSSSSSHLSSFYFSTKLSSNVRCTAGNEDRYIHKSKSGRTEKRQAILFLIVGLRITMNNNEITNLFYLYKFDIVILYIHLSKLYVRMFNFACRIFDLFNMLNLQCLKLF